MYTYVHAAWQHVGRRAVSRNPAMRINLFKTRAYIAILCGPARTSATLYNVQDSCLRNKALI